MCTSIKTIIQNDNYNTELFTYQTSWDNPIASIIIFHGMAEHHKRYLDFTAYLNSKGFDVYLFDHRGHGENTRLDNLGFFSSQNGDKKVVDDAITISKDIKANMRTKRLFLIGHSMGSIIARNVIQEFDEFNGVILIGSTHPNKLVSKLGKIIGSLELKSKGPKHLSARMNSLLFNNKKYNSLNKTTKFDWLSRDNKLVESYISDPFCGFICTTSFYINLIDLSLASSNIKGVTRTNKELPIYIISGSKDPVSSYGKEIKTLYDFYIKLKFKDVSFKLYEGGRHEILNEINKEEVYKDIINWLSLY